MRNNSALKRLEVHRSMRGKKYQFVSRSGSDSKSWVIKARMPPTNVGFFNRYKPQGDRTNLNVRSEAWKAQITVK